MPASARRSPRFSSDKVYLGRLSRSISRRVSSGVRARVMALDSPPNGIAFPCTPPFISWSMVCRVPGWHFDHERKEKGCHGSWDGSPRYGVNQRRGQGVAPPGVALITRCSIDRSDLKRPIDRERGPAPNWLCACPAFINTSDGDANTGSDDDAGSGHTRKRGVRSARRLAVWRRLAVGQSCRHSGAG